MMAESTAQSKRRREKPVLSCTFCRGRKLRCDRQSPCSACVRHGKAPECTYSSSEQERRNAVDYRPHAKRQQARQRVARLENLVMEMRDMAQSSRRSSDDVPLPSVVFSDPGPSLRPRDDHIVDSMGTLSLTDDHAVYVGSSHWVTILDDIQRLKDELSDLDDCSEGTSTHESTPFDAGSMRGSAPTRISLLSSIIPLPREQILAMIPPRRVVDRLVSQFFNAFEFAPSILHRENFLAEYASFWKNPSVVPIMWVGLLFSVLSMSAFLQQQDIGPPGFSAVESQEMLETYRTLTIHCLVAGDYLRPTRYTIETLALHFAGEQNVNFDTDISSWVLAGVVTRIALRMGLHRDPSHWPNIRPMQAELRRRLWIILYQMDFFTSTQVGLPRIIKDSQCDTRPPAHLFDQDISYDTEQMPPERPLTEPTPLLYIIQRHKIIQVAAEIYDATEAATPSDATMATLQARLDRAIDDIPENMKFSSLEASIADDPVQIGHRIYLDILIHKAVCLLHRKSFIKETADEDSTKSNKLCIDAALAILEHQRRVSEETQPGGLMFGIRWKVVTSSLSHEFLQATMVLCFALSKFDEASIGKTNLGTQYRRDDILAALSTSRSLWEKNFHRSVEARRAAEAITNILKKDLDKSSSFTSRAFDGFLEQIPGASAQSYLNNFDYGQSMSLDPSFAAFDNDPAAFGSIIDDFIAEHAEEDSGSTH